MKSNKNGVKILTATLVFAVAIAGIAIVVSDDSSGDPDSIISNALNEIGSTGTMAASENNVYVSYPTVTKDTAKADFTKFINALVSKNTGSVPQKITFGNTDYTWSTDVWKNSNNTSLADDVFGTTETYPQDISIIVLKNDGTTQLTVEYKIAISVSTVAALQEKLTAGYENFVLSGGLSNTGTLTIPTSIEILGSNKLTNSGTITFSTATDNTNALEIDSNITNSKIISGTGWSYDYSNKTLTLNGYNGKQYFYGYIDTVDLTGNNTITASTENSADKNGKHGLISTYGGSIATSDMTIQPSDGVTTAPTLTLNPLYEGGYGIGAWTTSDAVRDILIKNITLTINEGGNRGIYGKEITIGDTDSEVKTTVSAYGYEKAIRPIGGDLAVNADATVSALLGTPEQNNSQGDDDYFGVKATAVTVKGKLTTKGLSASTISVDGTGVVVVDGSYTQNPTAGIPVKISGLYLTNTSSVTSVYTTDSLSTADKTTGIYLYNADYYGNISVMNASGTVVEKIQVVTDDAGLAQAMDEEKVTSIIMTSALSSDVVLKKDVTFKGTIDNSNKVVTIANGASLNVSGTYTGPVKNGNNTMSLNLLAGNYSVIYGSVEINGVITSGSIELDKDDNKIQGIVDGTITISDASNMKKIFLSGDLTINGTKSLTVGTNNVLIIPEGRTLTVDGTLTVNGAVVVYGELVKSGSGSISFGAGGGWAKSADATITGVTLDSAKKQNILIYEGATAIENTISGNTEWNTATYLTGQLTIEEGVTVTIGTKGYLDLRGNQLIVKGTLVVNGYINNTIGTGTIYMTSTGTIENAGTIGKDSNVIVSMYDSDSSYSGVGSVTLKNVNGIGFGIQESYVGATKTYTLVLSGDVSKKGDSYYLAISNAIIDTMSVSDLVDYVSGNVVTITNSTVKTDLTIGNRAVVKIVDAGVVTLGSNASLVVDGELAAGTGYVKLLDGAVASINGKANVKFSAKTGTYNTYTGDYRTNAETALEAVSSITLNNLTGITIDVTSRSFVDGTTSKIEQMLNVSGSASLTKNSTQPSGYESSGSVTIVGNVYVAVQKNLDLAASMTVTTTSGVLITEGSATTAGSAITNYKGAQYSVKVPNTTGTGYTIVNHYTTFDSAYAAIDTAESKTIALMGGYEFAKNYTIKADQSVTFENSTATIKYAISKDATVTVEKDGTLSNGFAASGIQGILIVNDGGTCTPATGSYEVKSTDTAGNVTYSGAAVAIENAVSGSTIDIVSAVEFTDKVTVPKDVTVKVANAASIDAKKGLSVNGTLVNNGTVSIANGYSLDVAGTVDNNATVSMRSNTTATITGTYTGVLTGCTVNAAKYSANGEDVYTSVESALKAISEMTIPADVTVYGKVSENVDVTLSDGMKMTIVGNEVTIDSIRLVAGSTLIVSTGVLTADIVGAVGKADTTGAISDAVIGTKKVSGITVKVAYNESTATTTMTATLNGTYTGVVALEEGTVTLDTAASTTFEFQNETTVRTLSISEGATLVVKNDVTFKDTTKKGFSNAGKIESKSGMTFNSINVGGEVVIAVEKTVNFVGTVTAATTTAPAKYTSTTIAGTVILSEKEGKDPAQASISGPVYIGSAPSTLGADGNISGKISFSTNGFAVVFDGSTLTTNVDGVKSTAYTINGDAFAKIYGDVAIAAINPIVDSLKDLDVTCTADTTTHNYTVYNITWKSGTSTATGNVGDYESVNATIGYNSVNVKISAAPGMLVYIDDFQVTTEKLLPIGEHTVTIYLQPDYEGTAVITFNGEKITDGKIVIKTEMLNTEPTLVVTGATPISPLQPTPTPTPVEPAKDDSMGITEYLLIVLVVLAAILVVVVAIRMMRS